LLVFRFPSVFAILNGHLKMSLNLLFQLAIAIREKPAPEPHASSPSGWRCMIDPIASTIPASD
jgi:hypothetical protein